MGYCSLRHITPEVPTSPVLRHRCHAEMPNVGLSNDARDEA